MYRTSYIKLIRVDIYCLILSRGTIIRVLYNLRVCYRGERERERELNNKKRKEKKIVKNKKRKKKKKRKYTIYNLWRIFKRKQWGYFLGARPVTHGIYPRDYGGGVGRVGVLGFVCARSPAYGK